MDCRNIENADNDVTSLVWEVFQEFVAPGYPPEGIETFRRFIQQEELNRLMKEGRLFITGCYDGQKLAGIAAVRDFAHISLFFVRKSYQGKGVAGNLFKYCLKKCVQKNPGISKVTVNSSPYAVEIYKRLGFETAGEVTTRDGIVHTPMKMDLGITICEMVIDDFEEFYSFWESIPGLGLSETDKPSEMQQFLQRNNGLSFCCKKGDAVIGTALCGHDGRRGYLYHVAVAQEIRGKGIGRMLVEKCLEELKCCGIQKCHLFVFKDNDLGNHFWDSLGWKKRDDIGVYSLGLLDAD